MYNLPYVLKRTEDLNKRHYFKEKEATTFFQSTTTWLDQVLPTAPGLISWYKSKTAKEIADRLSETSHRGTFLHTVTNEYVQNNQSFPLTQRDEYIQQYVE